MRATKALRWVVLVGLGFVGCNPSSFDSILDKAPVLSFSPPGSSTSSLFVLPLPAPAETGTTSAARMLVANKESSYIGVADFDVNGKVKLSEASSNDEANIGGSVHSAAVRADGTILVGAPRAGTTDPPGGRTSVLSFTGTPASGYTFSVQTSVPGTATTPRVGIAVAAGNVTGATTGNFVVAGDNTLQVLGPDGKIPVASTSCSAVQLASATDYYAFRPLVVGDLLAGGLDEIVLGAPGKVNFVQYNLTTGALDCFPVSLTLGVSANFGSSLAVADFDGDGHKDLAVGVPPDKVVVYHGPLDFGTPPSSSTAPLPWVTITNAQGATGFGQRLAAYTLPGSVTSELLVADPGGTAGGRQGGGRMLRFPITGQFATLTDANADVILFDSNGDAGQGVFGLNLGDLTFNTGLCVPGGAVQPVPWATNGTDILTFFNYPVAPPAPAPDPRCFALKP